MPLSEAEEPCREDVERMDGQTRTAGLDRKTIGGPKTKGSKQIY